MIYIIFFILQSYCGCGFYNNHYIWNRSIIILKVTSILKKKKKDHKIVNDPVSPWPNIYFRRVVYSVKLFYKQFSPLSFNLNIEQSPTLPNRIKYICKGQNYALCFVLVFFLFLMTVFPCYKYLTSAINTLNESARQMSLTPMQDVADTVSQLTLLFNAARHQFSPFPTSGIMFRAFIIKPYVKASSWSFSNLHPTK